MTLPREASIMSAELIAMGVALESIDRRTVNKYTIFSDSRSAIMALKQINKLPPLTGIIKEMMDDVIRSGITFDICWVPAHIGVMGNEAADAGAGRAASCLDFQPIAIPAGDYTPLFRNHFRNKWQAQWNQQVANKLYSIQPRLSSRPLVVRPRREEVVLSRLRMGHTRLTHSYLLEGESRAPLCEQCSEDLTVIHILSECEVTRESRMRLFPSLGDLDGVTRARKMLSYDGPLSCESVVSMMDEVGAMHEI